MSLYIPVIFVSVLYISISYFINQDNAKYLLSGYNTMSEEKRKKFDIKNYLIFFKRFFKQQAVYSFFVFQLSFMIFEKQNTILIWSAFLIISPIYLIIKSQKFHKK